ncbi:hypothetical protein [Oleomonas cavernae]|uniref:hypothetical protein n=1 Tax=Oleomonas cavernae TaxID=2320859 RepID=UPI0011C476C6|nr:hypothetical protein [Oleomonas cavernae]
MNQMQSDTACGPVVDRDYSEVLGTPFKVILANGVTEYFDSHSKKMKMEIKDVPGLIAAIVQSRAVHPRKLSGDDLKFIRSALHMKSWEVASAVELSAEHYSRCEAGVKIMSSDKEKFYRMFVFLASWYKDKGAKRISAKKILETTQDPSSHHEASEAISAFGKIFFGLKLNSVYPVDEELVLHFYRNARPPECPTCTDDEKWQKTAA